MEILRSKELSILNKKIKVYKVVGILGPRQCGKTTLAHQFARSSPKRTIHFFDLEDPVDLRKLDEPMIALASLSGIVIIDEIQRKPDLFQILRVIVDRNPKVRFLILGSASRDLIAQSSETLAGRIGYIELGGFDINIVKKAEIKKLWFRGGFPLSFLQKSNEKSYEWRQDFVTTFLERDIPNLGLNLPAKTLRQFWIMISHYHGQIFNSSEIGRSLSLSDHTAKRYLDILTGTFLIRQIQPWHYNTKKRLVKRPKIYFRDTGILHLLLSIKNFSDLENHPKLGASWEGFALEQTIYHLNLSQEEIYFWATHAGAELDLIFQSKGKLYGIEFKYSDAPKLTPSIKSALSELPIKHIWVIYPGNKDYTLARNVSVVPIENLSML